MNARTPFFSKELFQFLVELKFNNERPWFQANKPRYEKVLKQPMLAFMEAASLRLKRIHPAYEYARMFRIYRDVRFRKDKTPYQTHASIQFAHRAALEHDHAPGFYFHLEPGENYVAAGMWSPGQDALKRIRAAIMKRPKIWTPLSKIPLWRDSYVRPPRGIDPQHRFLTDLKRKHFLSWVDFKDKDVLAPDFLGRFEKACKQLTPLVAFLNDAVGLK